MTIDGNLPDAGVLDAESDSDWAIGHSTTGWACYFGGSVLFIAKKMRSWLGGEKAL